MSQRYNDNTKRRKSQDALLGILKIYDLCWNIQHGASSPGESAAGVTYLYTQKVAPIFPLKVDATLLNGSRQDKVGG